MGLILLFALNIVFIVALWYLDINHSLDRLGEKDTRGLWKISPEQGFRYSQHVLILTLFLLDVLFIMSS